MTTPSTEAVSTTTDEKFGPGCHIQILRVKRDEPFWVLICDCCGGWSASLNPPDGVKACLTCLRHGHGTEVR